MYQLKRNELEWEYIDKNLGIRFTVPGECTAKLLLTPDAEAIQSEADVEESVKNPRYGQSLRKIAEKKHARSACILVSDATRAVPTARIIRYVVRELTEAQIRYEQICAFVAIGVHRDASEEEMKTFLGELYGKIRIENHTPFDKENLICLGETSRHTPVWVNKRAYACDLHIQIGKVEPHEFAGFSGGRKSVLPGISVEETIRINHRPEMILQQKAAIGVLEGNPVHEDMEEAAEKFGIDFGVNLILNQQLELSAVFAGEMKKSHQAAVEQVRARLGVSVKRPDILV
ncbi:MAG: lactate racemase domain-containing protein, partial [Schaedlerella arabinosiphila]|nr:lactate racemase domain-containing protein [Schaedlerella arabinosiphila]